MTIRISHGGGPSPPRHARLSAVRCAGCAAEVSTSATFCPICGRRLERGFGSAKASTASAHAGDGPGPEGSMSLFELPVAPAARITRIVVVLLLDAVLAGAGIAMILSYWSGRHAAAAPPAA